MTHQDVSNLVYGKDKTKSITSIEVNDGLVKIHFADGSTRATRHDYFILWSRQLTDNHLELNGDQHFKYFTKRDNRKEYRQDLQWARKYNHDISVIWNEVEQYMTKNGVTYYKGMDLNDVKVLSFDIETTGLKHDATAKTLLITNTWKTSDGKMHRKLFSYDQYSSDKAMIAAWCDFVQQLDPHILTGHNILGFDLPYLMHCHSGPLKLGRGNTKAILDKYTRKFRKDGSQTYDYNNINIPGREIVDTWFLSIKYDVGRKYPNYRLKDIIKYEGLEVENRQHYDASKIRENYKIPEEWEKIKNYAIYDADDSYNLFYLMSPSYFYYAQSVSKPFQEIILGATGSQVNNIMVRSYLQNAHSIPQASKTEHFQGGISFGEPGIYEHVCKVDVASMYPSVILDQGLYNVEKDPKCNLLTLTRYFTTQRLHNKGLHKETGKRYYKDLSEAQKIVINSIYGFLGCPGLSFNSPDIAATITSEARRHLNRGIKWAEDKGYVIANADTDSFVYKPSQRLTMHQFNAEIAEINELFPEAIKWENDGRYRSLVIVKAKNYAMKSYTNKATIKGSGLKGTMKEAALREYMSKMLDLLLMNKLTDLPALYMKYVNEIKYLENISRWVSKKTITKAVLNPGRTNEQRVLDACIDKLRAGELVEGDKIQVFFKEPTVLELEENYRGTYDIDTLFNKLFVTTKIFSNIIDIKEFQNFKLKRNKESLAEL